MGVICPAVERKRSNDKDVVVFNTMLPKTAWARSLVRALGFEPIN